MLCLRKGHVPPCYQSQLIIMLCFHERSLRAINHNSSSCCVFERGSPPQSQQFSFHEKASSVLSITTHHHCERHVLCAINHNSLLFSRGTSSSINHNSSCVLKGARPSVLSITTHHQCHERHVPPCYQSQHIMLFSRKARPSVLSITTHHHVVFSRKAPCYQSQLIIMLLSQARPPCYQSSSSLCFHERGTSLRAINHNSSSC
jgi:hypothetical protein